jgi:hypothetical protein
VRVFGSLGRVRDSSGPFLIAVHQAHRSSESDIDDSLYRGTLVDAYDPRDRLQRPRHRDSPKQPASMNDCSMGVAAAIMARAWAINARVAARP